MSIRTTVVLLFALFLYSNTAKSQVNESANGLKFNQLSSVTSPIIIDPIGSAIISQTANTNRTINTDTYILNSGDVVSFGITGVTSLEYKFAVIDASGNISIPEVGLVTLKQLSIEEAYEKINTKIQEVLNNSSLSYFTVSYPRTITVSISGNIPNNGQFNMPGLTTLADLINIAFYKPMSDPDLNIQFNSLNDLALLSPQMQLVKKSISDTLNSFRKMTKNYQIDLRSSLRNVVVYRNQELFGTFDLTEYLLTNNEDHNPVLQNGDHVILPENKFSSETISISGAVNNPLEIPFKKGDSFTKLIIFAGGLKVDADSTKVKLYRKNSDKKYEVNYYQMNDIPALQQSDHIIIESTNINPRHYGTFKISGNVVNEGIYPFEGEHIRLKKVLDEIVLFKTKAAPTTAYIVRKNSSSTPTKNEILRQKRTSSQFLEGLEYLEFENQLLRDLEFVNLTNTNSLESIILQDGDELVVSDVSDGIIVFGQVNQPGKFAYQPSLTVNDYLSLAQGLSMSAQKTKIFIIKNGTQSMFPAKEVELEVGDRIFVDRIPYEDFTSNNQFKLNRDSRRLQFLSLMVSVVSTTILAINVLRR